MAFYGKVDGEWEKFSNIETYKDFALVVCGDDGSVIRISEDGGSSLYDIDPFTDSANGVEMDSELNAYVVSSDGSFKKINSSGTTTEELVFGDNFISVALSPTEENVFIGNETGSVYKFPSSSFSNEEWESPVGGNVNALEAGRSRNVYASSVSEMRKLDRGGNETWIFEGDTRAVSAIGVGEDGQAYESTRDQVVRKVTSYGEEDWAFGSFTAVVDDVALDEDSGNVYGVAGSEIRKLDANTGNQIFEFTTLTSNINTVSIDANGMLYIGQDSGDVRKLRDTGNSFSQEWIYDQISTPVNGSGVILKK